MSAGLTEPQGFRAGVARTGHISRKPLWWEKINWLGTVWRGQQKKDPQGISVFPSSIE